MTTRLQRGLEEGRLYDLVIVGGGITGCALAWEAASSGLSVALVEKSDVGSATSAATGKLVHGGLRYLKNFEVGLVRESLAERRILSRLAPGLVEPIPIVLPDPGLVEHLGLSAYDLLSHDRNRGVDAAHRIPAHRRMGADELARHGLGHLERALLYHDCMMPSPERLTLAFLRSAVAYGAHFLTRARATRLRVSGTRVEGVEVHDVESDTHLEVRGRVVVNATGPWAHDLLLTAPQTAAIAGPRPPVRSEGLYLVTRKLSDVMVLFVSEHGHFSFAPWRGHSLIGPTETPYRGPVEDWAVTGENVRAFLDHVNRTSHLPEPLRPDDVLAVYGGLRPLSEATEDTYTASRASEALDHRKQGIQGLITATGGKYTTSRAFAVSLRKQVDVHLGRKGPRSVTRERPLDACAIGLVAEAVRRAEVAWPAVSSRTLDHLVRFYGTDHREVLALAREDPGLAEVLDADGEILAQVVYAVRYEAACTLADVLLRRTGLGTLGLPDDAVLERVAEVVARELGWTSERTAQELAEVRQRLTVPWAPLEAAPA